MSEYDVFVASIPMIAEMVVRCRRMDKQDYEEWKREVIESADDVVREFVRKVLICIDMFVTREGGAMV